MYKRIVPIVLLAPVLLLAACSRGTTLDTDSVAAGAFEMSPEMEILIGTLQLDGTDQEVDAAQAEELLPLWQMLKLLAASDTAAQEELDAVAQQIQKAMTADQMAAIDALNLSPQDMFAVMQDMGLSMGAGDGAPSGGGSSDFPAAGFPGGGDIPSGGFQGGSGGPPSGSFPGGGDTGGGFDPQSMTTEQRATAQAMRANNSRMRLPTQLLDALIEYLLAQAQS